MNNGGNMKFIEYVVSDFEDPNSFSIIMVNIEEIALFKKTSLDNIIELSLKSGEKHYVAGNYKTVTNRYFYTLSKKHNLYEDDIIRPSLRVLHKVELLESDVSFIDKHQLKGFILSLMDICDETHKNKLISILKKAD